MSTVGICLICNRSQFHPIHGDANEVGHDFVKFEPPPPRPPLFTKPGDRAEVEGWIVQAVRKAKE